MHIKTKEKIYLLGEMKHLSVEKASQEDAFAQDGADTPLCVCQLRIADIQP